MHLPGGSLRDNLLSLGVIRRRRRPRRGGERGGGSGSSSGRAAGGASSSHRALCNDASATEIVEANYVAAAAPVGEMLLFDYLADRYHAPAPAPPPPQPQHHPLEPSPALLQESGGVGVGGGALLAVPASELDVVRKICGVPSTERDRHVSAPEASMAEEPPPSPPPPPRPSTPPPRTSLADGGGSVLGRSNSRVLARDTQYAAVEEKVKLLHRTLCGEDSSGGCTHVRPEPASSGHSWRPPVIPHALREQASVRQQLQLQQQQHPSRHDVSEAVSSPIPAAQSFYVPSRPKQQQQQQQPTPPSANGGLGEDALPLPLPPAAQRPASSESSARLKRGGTACGSRSALTLRRRMAPRDAADAASRAAAAASGETAGGATAALTASFRRGDGSCGDGDALASEAAAAAAAATTTPQAAVDRDPDVACIFELWCGGAGAGQKKGVLTFEDLRAEVSQASLDSSSLRAIVKQYDTDGDDALNEAEFDRMLSIVSGPAPVSGASLYFQGPNVVTVEQISRPYAQKL